MSNIQVKEYDSISKTMLESQGGNWESFVDFVNDLNISIRENRNRADIEEGEPIITGKEPPEFQPGGWIGTYPVQEGKSVEVRPRLPDDEWQTMKNDILAWSGCLQVPYSNLSCN